MKKIISLSLLCVFLLAGCSSKDSPNIDANFPDSKELSSESEESVVDIDAFNSELEKLNSADGLADCDRLEGANLQLFCKDNYYFSLAVNSNNPSVCNDIVNEDLARSCKQNSK